MSVVVCSCVDSDLVRSVAARIGENATTFTTITESSYRRLAGGTRLERLWLRWRMSAGYLLRLAWRIGRAPNATLWVVTTNPFFAPGVVACIAGLRGQRVVHHVFDLYPDALEAAGVVKQEGFVSQLIAAWTRFTQRNCAAAVYLGEELRRHTEGRYGAAPCSVVIAVSADEREFAAPEMNGPFSTRPLSIHYGGQLGAMHDAAGLTAGVAALAVERAAGRVSFDFMAGGSGARQLTRFAGEPGITLQGTTSSAEWRQVAVRHQIGLVALTPAGMHVCLPSKTHAMMAAGLAIIAICPARSDLAALVRDTGAGWVIDNTKRSAAETGRAFAELARELVAQPELVREARRRARHAAETTYGHIEIGRRWGEFVGKLEGGGG